MTAIQSIVDVLSQVAIALFGNGIAGEGAVAGAIPTFWNWLTSAEVLPVFVLGITVSLLLLAVRVCKSVFWGV